MSQSCYIISFPKHARLFRRLPALVKLQSSRVSVTTHDTSVCHVRWLDSPRALYRTSKWLGERNPKNSYPKHRKHAIERHRFLAPLTFFDRIANNNHQIFFADTFANGLVETLLNQRLHTTKQIHTTTSQINNCKHASLHSHRRHCTLGVRQRLLSRPPKPGFSGFSLVRHRRKDVNTCGYLRLFDFRNRQGLHRPRRKSRLCLLSR